MFYSPPVKRTILQYDNPVQGRRSPDRLLMRERASPRYQQEYMDLRVDYTFKRVFGTEINKDLLIHFLNSLFAGRKNVAEVEFCPTERQGEDEKLRTVIYDILCKEKDGTYFLIEMQRAHQDFFENRLLHYGCRLVSAQVPSGRGGDRYEIKEVFVISLLDFMLWDDPALLQDPLRRYLRSVDMSWTDTSERFGLVEWIFIQLPMFNKPATVLDNDLERWIYLMKNLSRVGDVSHLFKDAEYRKLLKITKINNLSRKELEMYTLKFDADREWQDTLSYAIRKGRLEGETIGEKRGEKRGEKLGEKRGEKRGERNKARLVVQRLIRNTSFDDREIAAMVDVEESFVKAHRRSAADQL